MEEKLKQNVMNLLDEIMNNEAYLLSMVHGMKDGLEKTIETNTNEQE